MGKFAKLFEVGDGDQLLCRLTENDDGEPCVNFETQFTEVNLAFSLAFHGDDGEEKARGAFEGVEQKNAEVAYEHLTQEYKKLSACGLAG